MNSEQATNGNDPTADDQTADDTESRAALDPFGSVLRGAAVWAEPPAGLEALIVEQIRSASAAPPESAVTASSRASGAGWRRVLPAVAAAAIAFTGGFLIAHRDDDDPEAVANVALTGTDLTPGASATGEVIDRGAGYAIRLETAGLPPAPDGSYYEGFLRADDGEMVSVGTFHMRGGDGTVVLWSGVQIAEYGTLVVSERVERSDADGTQRVVLEGELRRR